MNNRILFFLFLNMYHFIWFLLWQGSYSPDSRYWYFIEGEGVDTYPTGVFSMDTDTGALFLLKAVDREEFPAYNVSVKMTLV